MGYPSHGNRGIRMAKRFMDSRMWRDPWFRQLPWYYKLFWIYLLSECDHAGFWKKDIAAAEFYLGYHPLNEAEILLEFNKEDKERVQVIKPTLWYIPSFVEFQYGELKPNNNTHIAIHNRLVRAGLRQGLPSPFKGVKEKEKEKDIYNSIRSIEKYWNSKDKLPKIIVMSDIRKIKLKERLKSPKFKESWKEVIDKLAQSKFCQGHNDRNWKVTIDWLSANDNNYAKVLEGKYDDKKDRFAAY